MKKIVSMFPFVVFMFFIVIVAVSRAGESERSVLFDQGHGQRFLIDSGETLGLSRLRILFEKEGVTVRATKEAFTPELLKAVKSLVIAGPFAVVTPPEIAAIKTFLIEGGRLSVMLHTGTPVAPLLQELGVVVSKRPVMEQKNVLGDNPVDFQVIALEKHELTAGLQGFNVYGCWGLRSIHADVAIIARSSQQAWFDANQDGKQGEGESGQNIGIMAIGTYGKGQFVVFGDDAIFQNQYLDSTNELLARNLIGWFKYGQDQKSRWDSF
jgi:hypothetical protein